MASRPSFPRSWKEPARPHAAICWASSSCNASLSAELEGEGSGRGEGEVAGNFEQVEDAFFALEAPGEEHAEGLVQRVGRRRDGGEERSLILRANLQDGAGERSGNLAELALDLRRDAEGDVDALAPEAAVQCLQAARGGGAIAKTCGPEGAVQHDDELAAKQMKRPKRKPMELVGDDDGVGAIAEREPDEPGGVAQLAQVEGKAGGAARRDGAVLDHDRALLEALRIGMGGDDVGVQAKVAAQVEDIAREGSADLGRVVAAGDPLAEGSGYVAGAIDVEDAQLWLRGHGSRSSYKQGR